MTYSPECHCGGSSQSRRWWPCRQLPGWCRDLQLSLREGTQNEESLACWIGRWTAVSLDQSRCHRFSQIGSQGTPESLRECPTSSSSAGERSCDLDNHNEQLVEFATLKVNCEHVYGGKNGCHFDGPSVHVPRQTRGYKYIKICVCVWGGGGW